MTLFGVNDRDKKEEEKTIRYDEWRRDMESYILLYNIYIYIYIYPTISTNFYGSTYVLGY